MLLPSWLPLLLEPALLVCTAWLTHWESLQGDFVLDDLEGMAAYDGKLQKPLSWGNLFKKFRYEVGKRPNTDKEWKAKKLPAFVSSPALHHRLSLIIFSGTLILLYSFLCRLIPQHVAFLTCLLFSVHPLGTQTASWISGIGYLTGTFFLGVELNLIYLLQDTHWLASPLSIVACMLLYGLIHWLAVEAMFVMSGVVFLLLFLKLYPFAIIAGLTMAYTCLHTFTEALAYRRSIFKEQQMGVSTQVYPRKFFTVCKTLAYYLKMSVFPKRMGIFHTFNYHYEVPYVETEDVYFWTGFVLLVGMIAAFILAPFPVQFAIVWYLAFLIFFLNWITANQFVTERYVWLPTLGVCLVVALYAPAWLYWSLVGVALMRTWAFLPTYSDLVHYYLSNLMNFPSSEVAAGNIGVALLQRGVVGTAIDAWSLGIQLNPNYDVTWYNLYNLIRARGPFNPNYFPQFFQLLPKEVFEAAFVKDPMRSHLYIGHFLLKKATEAKTCHFPDAWKKELSLLENELSKPMSGVPMQTGTATLVHPLILEPARVP